jgi:hypothetical protein
VLVGERVASLAGAETLAKLASGLRLVLFDVRALDVPALDVAIGVPTHVEKQGHWLNVDGVRRELNVAMSAPNGVPSLESTLAQLEQRVAGAGATTR